MLPDDEMSVPAIQAPMINQSQQQQLAMNPMNPPQSVGFMFSPPQEYLTVQDPQITQIGSNSPSHQNIFRNLQGIDVPVNLNAALQNTDVQQGNTPYFRP
jgi:hypothetical protein